MEFRFKNIWLLWNFTVVSAELKPAKFKSNVANLLALMFHDILG